MPDSLLDDLDRMTERLRVRKAEPAPTPPPAPKPRGWTIEVRRDPAGEIATLIALPMEVTT